MSCEHEGGEIAHQLLVGHHTASFLIAALQQQIEKIAAGGRPPTPLRNEARGLTINMLALARRSDGPDRAATTARGMRLR